MTLKSKLSDVQNGAIAQEKDKNEIIQTLTQSVRELDCFYNINRLIECADQDDDIFFFAIFQGIVDFLPNAFVEPEAISVELKYKELFFKTEKFFPSTENIVTKIIVKNNEVGSISVFYNVDDNKMRAFSQRERNFVNSITEILVKVLERKEAEEQLKISEKKFLDIFYSSRSAICILQNNAFVDCNDAMVSLFGFSCKQEIMSLHPSDISPKVQQNGESSFELVEKNIASALETGGSTFSWNHITADNESFPAEVTLIPIIFNKVPAIYAIIKDMRENLKLQKEKTLMQERIYETSKLASIGELASGIGHEINNPLTIIKGYLKLLNRQLESKEEISIADVKDHFAVINNSVNRISTIVSSLRSYVHTDMHENEALNIHDQIDNCLLIVSGIYGKVNIQISKRFVEDSPKILGNAGKFQQVILTIVSICKNSIVEQNMSDGKISIYTEVLGNLVNILIEHNGLISKCLESVDELNEELKFVDLRDEDCDEKQHYLCANVGIAKHIIEGMQGKFSIFSEENHGVKFLMQFPLF